MNEGQQKFVDFVLKRVKEGNEDEAEKLLSDTFRRQDSGDFTQDHMQEFVPKMLGLLKPEYVTEVRIIMQDYDPNN